MLTSTSTRITVANGSTTVYGLHGITHGFAQILTILCEDASSGWIQRLNIPADEFYVVAGIDDQHPVQLRERTNGAIERFIQAHAVCILDNTQWMQMKQRRRQQMDNGSTD